MKKPDAVVLLSGGLDSIVLSADLMANGRTPIGLHLRTGRLPSEQELHSVKKFAFANGIPLEIVDLSGLQSMLRGYMPVNDAVTGEYDVGCSDAVATKGLAAIALYFGQLTHIEDVYMGLINEPSLLTRNMSAFLPAMSDAINVFEDWPTKVKLHAPYLAFEKKDVISQGLKLGVDLTETWSCYYANATHCGKCPACSKRKQAFVDASIADPTIYLP